MSDKSNKVRVRVLGRAGLRYERGDHVMLVDSEMLAGPEYDMVIYSRSITTWQPPHENEPISEDERRSIAEDIEKRLSRTRVDWQ